jgi:hypothetical protein
VAQLARRRDSGVAVGSPVAPLRVGLANASDDDAQVRDDFNV